MPTSLRDLTRPTVTRPTAVPNANSGKETVFRGLVAGLVKGRWQDGARLTEAEAVKCFGVSRTPVREAFLELQGIGLIELRRNCGAILNPFGPRELCDIYAVRSLLEVAATRLASPNLNQKHLESLATEIRLIRDSRGIDPDWKYDQELHRTIAVASGNQRLAGEIERYGGLIQTIREIVGEQAVDIHTQSAEEHLAILDALLEGDSQAAAEAMRRHLEQASQSGVHAMNQLRG